MSELATRLRSKSPRKTRVSPTCPHCRRGGPVYRLRDAFGRVLRTRSYVFACDGCASVFTAR